MKTHNKIILLLVVAVLASVPILFWKSDVTYSREKSEVYIGNGFFSHYAYVVYDDHVELLEYKGEKKNVDIPKRLLGKPVTVIGESCFAETKIETVYLSSNIQEIKERAFQYCDFLQSIGGEAEIEVVNRSSFNGCDLLRTVEIGNSIKRIERFAFAYCENLETIGEQPLLEYIGEDAFNRSGELNGLQIGNNVELGDSVFHESKWLANQTDEFVIIGNGSLVGYNGNSENVEIPYGVTKFDDGVFEFSRNREKIRTIIIPETVNVMVSGCLAKCGEIKVYIPDSVKVIDEEHQELVSFSENNGLTYAGNNDTLTIVTTSGSTAEAYAEKYGIKCEIVEGW